MPIPAQDIDWKGTWRLNGLMDLGQTLVFSGRGIDELNPLWKSMVKRKQYSRLALSWVASGYVVEQIADRHRNLYVWLSAVELIVVSRNASRHGVGFPLLSIRF